MELSESKAVYSLDKKDARRIMNLPGMNSLRFSFVAPWWKALLIRWLSGNDRRRLGDLIAASPSTNSPTAEASNKMRDSDQCLVPVLIAQVGAETIYGTSGTFLRPFQIASMIAKFEPFSRLTP